MLSFSKSGRAKGHLPCFISAVHFLSVDMVNIPEPCMGVMISLVFAPPMPGPLPISTRPSTKNHTTAGQLPPKPNNQWTSFAAPYTPGLQVVVFRVQVWPASRGCISAGDTTMQGIAA